MVTHHSKSLLQTVTAHVCSDYSYVCQLHYYFRDSIIGVGFTVQLVRITIASAMGSEMLV